MSQIATGGAEPCTLTVGARELEVLELEATEGVSQLFEYRLSCVYVGDAPPVVGELVGQAAHILLRDGFGAERPVVGIVAQASAVWTDEQHAAWQLWVRPQAYRLTLGRDCRTFLEASVVDIVRDVLERGGVEARFQLTREYSRREYTAQYREDDWTFVSRLLEQEGIYYWFDHEEAESRLVLADRSEAAVDLAGGALIELRRDAGAQAAGGERVEWLCDEVCVMPDRFTLRSFDPARTDLRVEGRAGKGAREWYDAPGAGPTEPEEASRRARIRLEAAQAERERFSGRATSVRLVPGRVLELRGHPMSHLDGRYFVTQAALRIRQRRRGTSDGVDEPLECRFGGIRQDSAFRAPEQTPRACQPGLQTARVAGPPGEEVYPDEAGQVRIQPMWDRVGRFDDKSGRWVRVVQRGTAHSMLLPRMGWHVLTLSEEGSVDLPVAVARIFDGEHPPTYPLPAAKTRVSYRTATTPGGGSFNELRFEDRQGSEELFIHASRDMSTLVNDSKTEQIFGNTSCEVGSCRAFDVGHNAAENVVGDQSVSVAGSDSSSTGVGRQKTIGGSETITIGGARMVGLGQTLSTDVLETRQLVVGGAQLDISLGDVQLTAPVVGIVVGGAMIKVTAGEMVESQGGSGTYQLIGGAKVEVAGQERNGSVTGAYVENVGASMTCQAKVVAEQSDSALSATVAGSVTAQAKEIIVSGDSQIELKCGGTSITITAGGVEICAPALDQSGGTIDAVAAHIIVY